MKNCLNCYHMKTIYQTPDNDFTRRYFYKEWRLSWSADAWQHRLEKAT